jgi:hypothetical protein
MLSKETKAYKNKLKYIKEYERTRTKRFLLQLHLEKDADIIEHLKTKSSMIDYVRTLIRADINK